ncbi:hypothetical protein Tco_0651040 [Tanacetum coccineum]
MASMNTRLNIEKLDGNIVQKHGGSKQVGFKQLGPGVETGGQRWLEDKHLREAKLRLLGITERRKVHLRYKSGGKYVTGVPGQKGAEGNVAENKKGVYES